MSISALFFKRFLQRPFQIASIVPSSKQLIERVSSKFDFSRPRIIAELGPGEGCHTRALLRRMHPESRLILFELDPEFSAYLKRQFEHDPRVEVLNTDAHELPVALKERGLSHCDYVLSGIPFSILDAHKKKELLQSIYDCLAPEPASAFIIYQVTNELLHHTKHFARVESEYCLLNIPPMFVTAYYRQPLNGHKVNGVNGVKVHPDEVRVQT